MTEAFVLLASLACNLLPNMLWIEIIFCKKHQANTLKMSYLQRPESN